MNQCLIGISTRFVQDSGYSIELVGATCAYAAAVRRLGALPVLIPLFEESHSISAARYADRLDALILTGGEDVDPQLYNEAPHAKLQDICRKRDDYEIALLHAFLAAGKKVLGICRGLQLINVAFGGTLYQDIDSQCARTASYVHTTKDDRWYHLAHSVSLQTGTQINRLLQVHEIMVNSIHHQAIKTLGDSLVASAYAEQDSIIEAIESTRYPSQLLAVQWHPETMLSNSNSASLEQLKLFAMLCS